MRSEPTCSRERDYLSKGTLLNISDSHTGLVCLEGTWKGLPVPGPLGHAHVAIVGDGEQYRVWVPWMMVRRRVPLVSQKSMALLSAGRCNHKLLVRRFAGWAGCWWMEKK